MTSEFLLLLCYFLVAIRICLNFNIIWLDEINEFFLCRLGFKHCCKIIHFKIIKICELRHFKFPEERKTYKPFTHCGLGCWIEQ